MREFWRQAGESQRMSNEPHVHDWHYHDGGLYPQLAGWHCDCGAGPRDRMSNEPSTEAPHDYAHNDATGTCYHCGRPDHGSRAEIAALAASRAETADLRLLLDVAEEAATQARAETAAAVAALKALVRAYVANRGTPHRFISTRTYEKHSNTEIWDKAEAVLDDLTAAAQAYKAEIARAAVEPWRERLADALYPVKRVVYRDGIKTDVQHKYPQSTAHRDTFTECEVCKDRAALLAQSPAASDE